MQTKPKCKPEIAIFCDAESFVLCERVASAGYAVDQSGGLHDVDAYAFTRTPYPATTDPALVLAVTRHRNPGYNVFYIADNDSNVIRIH